MAGPVDPAPTLLDGLLPTWDHRTMQGHATRASVDAAARAMREVTVGEAKMARSLEVLRHPRLIRGARFREPWAELGDGDMPFLPLGENESEIALGFVGRPWPRGGPGVELADRDAFLAYEPVDTVKIAMAIRAVPVDYGTLLVGETRIEVGPQAKRPFGAYWRLIRVGSGMVRTSLLRAIARRAEAEVDVKGSS